jgi:hypothetical protein
MGSRIKRIRELTRLSRADLTDKAWILEIEITAAMNNLDIARLIEEHENGRREKPESRRSSKDGS